MTASASTGKSRIAVVDDDDLFRESIGANLHDVGFDVDSFDSGVAFLSAEPENMGVDAILLDWKMPEMNGIDVLRALRERGVATPVIFLTVLGQQIYEEAALAGGAVDFIEKSRSFSIVHRRIRMIVDGVKTRDAKKEEPKDSVDIEYGDLTLNARSKRATWRGEAVPLTLTEYNIVSRLATNVGEDVSYRELYDQVHGRNFLAGEGEAGVRANVRALIKRIRAKFRSIDPDFEKIANYPSFGYRWEQ